MKKDFEEAELTTISRLMEKDVPDVHVFAVNEPHQARATFISDAIPRHIPAHHDVLLLLELLHELQPLPGHDSPASELNILRVLRQNGVPPNVKFVKLAELQDYGTFQVRARGLKRTSKPSPGIKSFVHMYVARFGAKNGATLTKLTIPACALGEIRLPRATQEGRPLLPP